MQILKQNKKVLATTTNHLYSYQNFLKNLNFNNILKKKNMILLKDQALLQIDDSYLFNIHFKENLFFPNLNKNKFLNKKYIYYIIQQKYKEHLLINPNNLNYFLTRLYIFLLLKKFNKSYLLNFYLSNKIEKINNFSILLKKKKPFYSYISGRILKPYKKYILISIYGLILKMNKKKLYHKRKIIYSRYRFYRLFYLYKGRSKFFKLSFFNIQKTEQKINFSRKNYIKEFKKKKSLKLNISYYLHFNRSAKKNATI